MQTTWIELGGVAIRAPVTAGTNLVLAVQCWLYFGSLRSARDARDRYWGGFFLMMAVATAAGVLKHGARHLLAADTLTVVLTISSLASGVSTYLAQQATISAHVAAARRPAWIRLVATQLALFTVANAVLGPRITLLIGNTVLGLVPVIAVEWHGRRAVRGAAAVSAGLAISILTGVVYLVRLSFGPWLNHIDIAHVLMGVSFLVIRRGVSAGGTKTWT